MNVLVVYTLIAVIIFRIIVSRVWVVSDNLSNELAYILNTLTYPWKAYKRPLYPKLQRTGVHIPRVMFKTGPKSYGQLPTSTMALHQQILSNNPQLSMVYFSDLDALNFIRSRFEADVCNAFMRLKPGAYKADLLRYCLMYEFGGVYSDLTQALLVPLDELIDFEKDELVTAADRVHPGCGIQGIQIAFMAAVPRLPVFRTAINMIVKNVSAKRYGCSPLSVTGPVMFKRALDMHPATNTRIEIEQATFKEYKYIAPPHRVVIIGRADNHRKVLTSAHYSKLWKNRRVFEDSTEDMLSMPCMVNAGVVIPRL